MGDVVYGSRMVCLGWDCGGFPLLSIMATGPPNFGTKGAHHKRILIITNNIMKLQFSGYHSI